MQPPSGNKNMPSASGGGLSEEAQAAISVIRALVASRKETSNVLSVLRDYKQLEGDALPYRKFGFSKVEDFLLKSGEFVIKPGDDQTTRIYIKPNRASAHIQEMIAAQKRSKPTGSVTKKPYFQAARQPYARIGGRDSGSELTAYSRIYQQMQKSGRNSSTNHYNAKRVTFGGGFQSSPPKGKPQGLATAAPQPGSIRPITNVKGPSGQATPANRNSNSSSPEANNNSRSTKNYNLNNGGQQLTTNDLRHWLNERNGTLSRSSVEMRQPSKALPTVSSTAALGMTTNRRQGPTNGLANARKLPITENDKGARNSSQPKEISRTSNQTRKTSGGNCRVTTTVVLGSYQPTYQPVVFGSGRMQLPPLLPLMSIGVTPPSGGATNPAFTMSTTKSVNSRLNVAKADLPSSAPTPVPMYKRAQSLDERNSISSTNGTKRPTQISQLSYTATTPSTPLPTLAGKKSLQDRLKINQEVADKQITVPVPIMPESKENNGTTPTPAPKPYERTISFPTGKITLHLNGNKPVAAPVAAPAAVAVEWPKHEQNGGIFCWDDPNATPVELLMRYSQDKGFTRPEYGYYKLKSGRFQCLVTVNGSSYSTYPEDYVSQFEGQFAAALNAIESIQRDESRQLYTVCLDSDREVAQHIHELLSSCPHGMFSNNIPNAFRETHRALLPDHWFAIIDQYANLLFVLEDGPGDTIVFARDQPSGSDVASNTSEAREMALNQLVLPWDEQYWNLYVTSPVSTVEVWARLVGKEYSDKMDTLITDIEMSMISNQAKAKKDVVAAVGEYYLVSISDCWFRVRVVEVNYEANQCQCFFIDIGDSEQIALDQLYRCDSQYLELPAQAICLTLEGLEDFSENPIAKHVLGQRINHRVLIGMILTKRDEYDQAEQSDGIGSSSLKVVLYDTSSTEDEIVNPILLQQICKNMPVPELNNKSVNYVRITYVDDQGDVYCQKDGAMNYIQKLITNLTQSDALEDQHRGLYNSKATEQQQRYLVKDETDGKWYRAALDGEESGPFCRMLYVDIGCRKRVNVHNIYRLDSLSLGLRSYPPQAIRMRMFELPNCSDPFVLARLRAFLKPAVPAMAKVFSMVSSILPLVKLYVHVSDRDASNNILVCVNEAIKIERELELGSERIMGPPRIGSNDEPDNLSGSDVTTASSSTVSTGASYSLASADGKELTHRFDALNLNKTSEAKRNNSAIADSPTKAVAKLAKITLPPVGQIFNVKVTIANNPKFFFIQPYSFLEQLDQLMHELQDYCMTKAQPVRKEQVRQGEAYAAVNNLGHWYRALVVNINPFGPTPIHAHFCDFGQFQQLDAGALRVLSPKFRVLPQQAIKAKLYGVKPLHNDWTISDAVRFKELTVNNKFASIVRSIQPDELNPQDELIELELIDVSTEDDVYLRKILVDEGRAVYTAEAHTV